MHRREFLCSAAFCACAAGTRGWAQNSQAVRIIDVTIDYNQRLGLIPADFMGLGYEISSIATPGLLSASSRAYVELVRQLGARGVIRVGGNTSDYSSFLPNALAVSAPKTTVVNAGSLRELAEFLSATRWSLMWGLNLGNGSVEQAVAEARAVADVAGDRLLAFEIGNEPDLYEHEGHRRSYSYDEYLKDYQRYKSAVRAVLPHAAFAGPDAAIETGWVERFAADEGRDLRLLTHHYYREGQSPRSTMDKLLRADPKLVAMLDRLQAASKAAGVPYRICETNSFSGGGRPDVSDTFGAALWALDYLCVLAWHGASGVNMETGMNQLGFISSYSPIADNQHEHFAAAPEYYGMLAFAQGYRGERVAADYDAGTMELTVYATVDANDSASVVIINKDAADAEVRIAGRAKRAGAQVLRLTAPSLDSKSGIRLDGAAVQADGRWHGKAEAVHVGGGGFSLHVPAMSAAIVTFDEPKHNLA